MKIKLEKGLKFNKEVISKLDESQVTKVKGGIEEVDAHFPISCYKMSCFGDAEDVF